MALSGSLFLLGVKHFDLPPHHILNCTTCIHCQAAVMMAKCHRRTFFIGLWRHCQCMAQKHHGRTTFCVKMVIRNSCKCCFISVGIATFDMKSLSVLILSYAERAPLFMPATIHAIVKISGILWHSVILFSYWVSSTLIFHPITSSTA